jgi:hypothetical protein
MSNLPIEICYKIMYLSCGPYDLDIYNKKKKICNEIFSYNKNDFYLNLTCDYQKTPELELEWNDYSFAKRIPKLISC